MTTSNDKLNSWESFPDAPQVINLGAGRQSSVMYLMACAGGIMPRPYCAVFADTGNEPQHVYDQLAYLQKIGSIPIHVVTEGNIYEDSMKAVSGAAPWGGIKNPRWAGPPGFVEGGGPIKRLCTEKYKIKPQKRFVRELMKKLGTKRVIQWRGHTINEVHRAKPDQVQYSIVRWPLLEKRMSNQDCAAWAEANGHPVFKWSACEICPFRLRDLRYARQLAEDKEAWERITVLDKKIRDLSRFNVQKPVYFNAEYIPMTEFIDKPQQPTLFDFDCDGGACGL